MWSRFNFFTFLPMRKALLVVLLLLSVHSCATHVAVLETMADGDAKNTVSLTDRQYLTNVLREQAVLELTAEENYTIMTRENISAMLPPGKAIEDCEGSCLAETGRNISADYVCQARVGRFGSKFTLSAELYETAGNKLVTSFNGRGADVEELLKLIEEKSPAFFRRVKELNKPIVAPTLEEVSAKDDSVTLSAVEGSQADSSSVIPAQAGISSEDSIRVVEGSSADSSSVILSEVEGSLTDSSISNVGESIPANVDDEPAKKSGVHWVPLSISAAVAVVGVVAAVIGNAKAKDASEKSWTTEDEYRDYHQDAKDYQKTRAVGIGLAIAGAVGVGLSIAF